MQHHLAHLADSIQGIVFAPGGRAGIEHHGVALRQGLPKRRFNQVRRVAHGRINLHLAAPFLQHAAENRRIGFDDIPFARVFRGRHDFIPRGDDAYLRLGDYLHRKHARLEQRADRSRREQAKGR